MSLSGEPRWSASARTRLTIPRQPRNERGVPELFDGPVPVMLTKAQEAIPRAVVAGQLAYEMKWDGYRAALQVRPDGTVRLWSRNGNDLSDAFPDLIEAAEVQVPPGIVLDGVI